MRDIDIPPTAGGGCGPFAAWCGDDAPGPDTFPTRAAIGEYLHARFTDVAETAAFALRHHCFRADSVRRCASGWDIHANGTWMGPYAEVLLALGQPAVTPDDQLADWQDHAQSTGATLAAAYPAHALVAQAKHWAGQTVAIRGLALSAFDILRALTIGQNGRFDGDTYIASGAEPKMIVPFSLDGRPPYPKPETTALDARFTPSDAETARFLDAMRAAAIADPDTARKIINDSLHPVVARILAATAAAADQDAIGDWLSAEWDKPGSQEDGAAHDVLQVGIAMATGAVAPSIGYIVGQVWRKWQDTVRIGFNPAATLPDTAKAIIGFDEGLKRYSYGTPVSSGRELAALIAAGIVRLDLSADPEITLASDGWSLCQGTTQITAEVMIDGVLPSPDLPSVTAPLVTDLIADGRLVSVADGLGAKVAADGTVVDADGTILPGLTFLGRLALGSVIAVDSLHDCFGAAADRWADGVVARLTAAD